MQVTSPATSRTSSVLTSMMLLASVLLLGVSPTVSAVGPNQNDMGMSSGDLPDNLSSPTSVPNLIFSGSTSGSGDLVSSTDEFDYLRVALATNEGLAAELSFASGDDFDLSLYDTNQNLMVSSYLNNPETVTTNSSLTNHGGMVYIEIVGYSFGGTTGSWNLTLTKFTVSNGTGGGGSGGGSSVVNCTGNNTVNPDILEPNDSTGTATSANLLPLSCSGLSIDSTTDVDYFEVDMIAGTTYYANITFVNANGDIDVGWDSASGGFLDSGTSTSNIESLQVFSSVNQTTYIDVYGYVSFGSTTFANTYDIEITTDNPGGGQTFESVDVSILNTTHATLDFSGLTNGTTYNYNHTYGQLHLDGDEHWGMTSNGTFNATGTTHSINITTMATHNESSLLVTATLFDATGAALNTDTAELYIEMLEIETTSSTTGDIELTNLSIGTAYDAAWIVIDYDEWQSNFTVSNDENGIKEAIKKIKNKST